MLHLTNSFWLKNYFGIKVTSLIINKQPCNIHHSISSMPDFGYLNIYGDLRMKKSLIALAALSAFATAAQAQSNVTIYGVLDAGITRASNTGSGALSNTGLTNGGLSTPRWGFRGTEDLGAGLKASFVLESEFLTSNGTGTTHTNSSTFDKPATLFNRASFVNLAQDGIGSIQLGHMNRQDYNMSAKYDVFGGNNIGGWLASNKGTVALDQAIRTSNTVQLQTASLGGLVLTYQHQYGGVAGNSSRGKSSTIGAEFTSGPFAIAATYADYNSATSASAWSDYKTTSVYAKYDMKVADLRVGFAEKETNGAAAKESGYFVGVRAPVTSKIGVLAQYNAFDNDAGMKPTTYALGATYAFSKRTTAYAIGAKSNQDNGSKQMIVSDSKYSGFQSTVTGKDSTAYSVGIRHTF
jgi:predicted porin